MVRKPEISSMTGFARSSGTNGVQTWNWEAKSVNGKGLDIRCRLPQGMDELDLSARGRASKTFTRGTITLHLSINDASSSPKYQVNRELLDQLVELAGDLSVTTKGWGAPRLDGLFAVKGVIEPLEEEFDDADIAARNFEIDRSLEDLLTSLRDARLEEGSRISTTLSEHLKKISSLTERAESVAAAQPAAIKEKIVGQMAELLEAVPALTEERLAQEAALLVSKADIREELDRLGSHLAAAAALLSKGGVVGRKLDFLCQEFNRETNTICSKAQDIELSNIGLELKAVIVQFREQVQNIE